MLNNMDHTNVLECSEFGKSLDNIKFTLKDKQVKCIGNIVENKHTICLLPAGYRKSMMYTLLPIPVYLTNVLAAGSRLDCGSEASDAMCHSLYI